MQGWPGTLFNASRMAHVQTSMIYATSSPNANKIIYRLLVADSYISSTPCGSQQIVLNKLTSWLNAFLRYFLSGMSTSDEGHLALQSNEDPTALFLEPDFQQLESRMARL